MAGTPGPWKPPPGRWPLCYHKKLALTWTLDVIESSGVKINTLELRSLMSTLVQTRKMFRVKGWSCGTGGGLAPWPLGLLPSALRLQGTQSKTTGRESCRIEERMENQRRKVTSLGSHSQNPVA